MGLSCSKILKAVMHWVQKMIQEDGKFDLLELTNPSIYFLVCETAAAKVTSGLQPDSKLNDPNQFVDANCKNSMKTVER